MKQQILKRIIYQTESNKSYSIITDTSYNTEEGVKLNPYSNSKHQYDNLIVVVKEESLLEKTNFNIRNTEFGFFLEVYSSIDSQVFIVDTCFSLEDIFKLIKKIEPLCFQNTIKYLKLKYGIKNLYFFK